jgi:hypothetical protein
MRIGWILLLALSRTAAAADITACLTTSAPSSPFGAKRIAVEVFRRAGLDLEWASARTPGCVHVRLAEGTPDDLLPGALAVSHPYRGCGETITVFFDRVRAQAAHYVNRETALLAYVLVHEIAHVVQGTDRHSDAGIMKARWNDSDSDGIYERRLGFLEEDVLLMRRSLAAGWCRQSPALIGRFEPGTASRPE